MVIGVASRDSNDFPGFGIVLSLADCLYEATNLVCWCIYQDGCRQRKKSNEFAITPDTDYEVRFYGKMSGVQDAACNTLRKLVSLSK